jgi:FkbH-like protein
MITNRTHAEYLRLAREIEHKNDKTFHKLAVLSSFTADFLKPYIMVESEELGLCLKPWFSPFNQYEQMVLDEGSALWRQIPDIVWISIRIEDVHRYLIDEFARLSVGQAIVRLSSIRDRLLSLVRATRQRFRGPILVSNFTIQDQIKLDIYDAGNPNGITHLVADQNHLLAKELADLTDIHIFDYSGCVAFAGGRNWRDRRLWYMGRIAVGPAAQQYLARQVSRFAAALLRPSAKCLVVDLDNTLWGGVIGDDGPGGIKIGDDYPGNIYKDFQSALLGLRHRGFLLAIASKNDEELVRQTLDSHPEMILRSEHFASMKINWDPKPPNIRKIAEELNIGLDSIVFIDDNPVERARVRAELPMVQVIELPSDILGFLPALRDVAALDKARVLDEDRLRADQYRQEAKRKELESGLTSIADFMRELQMCATVGRLDPNTLERIHQLIHKTNQFNLTTRRHLLDEIKRLSDSPDSEVAWLRLSDRFGDMGLVCVGVIRKIGDCLWEIDTFLMSCRVMGRNAEDAFLSYLAELALAKGATILRGIYIKTSKNKPVENFYNEHKFKQVAHPDDSTWVYEIDLKADTFPWPEHIKRFDVEKGALND